MSSRPVPREGVYQCLDCGAESFSWGDDFYCPGCGCRQPADFQYLHPRPNPNLLASDSEFQEEEEEEK